MIYIEIIIFWSDQEGATFLNQQKMKFLCLFTIIAACFISAQACDDCKYDCPLIGKEIYAGKVLGCGYNMAQDWGTCGKDEMISSVGPFDGKKNFEKESVTFLLFL